MEGRRLCWHLCWMNEWRDGGQTSGAWLGGTGHREMEARLGGIGCSHLEVSDHAAWSSGTLAASEKAQQCHS